MAVETADAVWIDVLPSMRGFATRVVQDAAGAGRKAGKAATAEFDKASADAGKGMADSIASQLKKAQAEVEKVSGELAKARDKEADAAGRVRVAEAQLEAVRGKAKATDAQKAQAEERLALSQRSLSAAQRTTIATTARLDQVQADAAARTKVLTEATERGESAMLRLGASLERVDTKHLDTGSRAAGRFAVSALKAATAAVAIGSATPGVAGMAVAIGQAAGAGALLPGVLLAGGAAAGVLKIGLSGVADALKQWSDGEKFTEAIAELAPAAQASLSAVRDLRPELIGLRNAVQEGLFTGSADQVKALAQVYLPLLRRDLPAISSEFGTARDRVTGFVAAGQTVNDVHSILDSTRGSVGDLSAGIVPLIQIVRDFGTIGAVVLGDLTSGFGGAAASAAAFVANARETGQLEGWIRTGLDVLSQFGDLIGNVFGLVNTVLGATQAQGGSALDTLIQITGTLLELAQSAEGTQALGAFFGAVHGVVEALLPGLRAVAGAVFDAVVRVAPYLPGVAGGFTAVAVALAPLIPDLVSLVTVLLPPLVSLITWLAPALPVLVVGFVAFRAALAGFNIIQAIVTFIRGWAAAQWALNAAMTANPIGLIIAGVAALVAAVVWIATQTTWFQDLWAVVWGAISAAASWAYDTILRPAFDGIVAALRWVGVAATWLWQNAFVPAAQAIGAAASWLWSNVLQPTFSFIDTAVRILAAVIITVLVTPAVIAFKLLAAVASWLWTNAIEPSFAAIGAGATWLWTTVLKPFVDLNVAAFRLLAGVALWLWQNGIKPALDGIAAAATWLWSTVLKPFIDLNVAAFRLLASVAVWLWTDGIKLAFDGIAAVANWLWSYVLKPFIDLNVAAFQLLASTAMWLYDNGIKPAFDAIGAVLRFVYDNTIAKVFDGMSSGVDLVAQAFDKAVGFIGQVWSKIKEIAAKPVNFIIETVYNQGIKAVWDKVAGFVNLDPLPAASPITFAGGGVLSGYAPGRDTVPALLSRGEAVLVPELVREIGPRNILAANAAASGRPAGDDGGFAGGGVVRRFAGGGVVGDVLSWVPGIGDDLAALWKDPAAWVKARIGGSGGLVDMLAAIPETLIGKASEWLSSKIGGFFGSGGGAAVSGQLADWIRAAMTITGVGADWFAPLTTLIMRESGGNPAAINLWDSNAQAGYPSQGLMQTIPQTFAAYRDPRLPNDITNPVANVVAGINYIKSRYGSIFAVQQAVGATPMGYDSGGWLPPGRTQVFNGTGRPEAVLTGEQWDALQNGNGGQFTGELYLDSGEFLGMVQGRIGAAQQDMGSAIAARRRL